MCQRPAALGIQPRVEVRVRFVQQLRRMKAIKPQEPVRLIETVLPQQRRLCIQGRQQTVLHHWHIGGIEYPLQPELPVQGFRQMQDVSVAVVGSAYDQLCALSRRGKHRRVPVFGKLCLALRCAVPYQPHRAQNGLSGLVRRQRL